MLGDAEVGAAIPTKDLQKSKQFYQEKLGLKVLNESEGGVLFGAGNGSKVFVYPSEFAGTNKATTAGWSVDDVEKAVAELKNAGVTFEQYDIPGASRQGEVQVMGELKAAWFKDPDGNILSVSNQMG